MYSTKSTSFSDPNHRDEAIHHTINQTKQIGIYGLNRRERPVQISLFKILYHMTSRPVVDLITPCNNIRIDHECEGRIEKSVPRIAVWHHEACRLMTNGDPEGRTILSYPHTNNDFFCSPLILFYFLF